MHTYKKCNKDTDRNYYKGKSFDFGIWTPVKTYINDDYKQDFVTYKNQLYACIRTNQNVIPTDDFYWTVCIDFAQYSGENFLIGNGFPEYKNVKENTIYLDLIENTFYKFSNNNWIIIGSMRDSFNWGEFN